MTTNQTDTAVTSRARRLAEDAAEAADVRRWQTHPDVVALRVERVRAQVDRLCWSGIVLGLAFTTANVQWFAAAGSAVGSLPWLTAWLLDPTVCLVLLAILRAEQVTARYQVHTGAWVRAAKWLTLAATYVMNTWSSWLAGSPAGVVLHSVPPLVVFVAAEAVTDLRDKLTDAVAVAFMNATDRAEAREPAPVQEPPAPVEEPAAPVHEPNTDVHEPTEPVRERSAPDREPAGTASGPAEAVRRLPHRRPRRVDARCGDHPGVGAGDHGVFPGTVLPARRRPDRRDRQGGAQAMTEPNRDDHEHAALAPAVGRDVEHVGPVLDGELIDDTLPQPRGRTAPRRVSTWRRVADAAGRVWRSGPMVRARSLAAYRARKAPLDVLRLVWFVLRGNWRWLVKFWNWATYADLRADARRARLAGDAEARRAAQELIRSDATARWAKLGIVVRRVVITVRVAAPVAGVLWLVDSVMDRADMWPWLADVYTGVEAVWSALTVVGAAAADRGPVVWAVAAAFEGRDRTPGAGWLVRPDRDDADSWIDERMISKALAHLGISAVGPVLPRRWGAGLHRGGA